MKTAIIDYDAGNIRSVEKAVTFLGGDVSVTDDPKEICAADHVILPGVGSFGSAMEKLRERHLIETIRKVCAEGTPFLGICLGLQILFESSAESPDAEGLRILPGQIVRIPDTGLKVPHVGWNSLAVSHGRLFQGLEAEPYVYFVHSYYLRCADPSIVTATADYGVTIDASVESGNVFACQFHPEKSGRTGLLILKNFLEV